MRLVSAYDHVDTSVDCSFHGRVNVTPIRVGHVRQICPLNGSVCVCVCGLAKVAVAAVRDGGSVTSEPGIPVNGSVCVG